MNYFSKVSLLLMGVIGLIPLNQQAQNQKTLSYPQDPDNYYFIKDQYMKAHPAKAKDKDEDDKDDQYEGAFQQWDWYWGNHLDAGSHIPGKKADMTKHLKDYLMGSASQSSNRSLSGNPFVCQTSLGNWTPYGPATFTAPWMGKVNLTWVNPSNNSEIYAGSSGGGMFHTTNAGSGVTWSYVNQVDASGNRFPSIGTTAITVDYTTATPIIYAGSSSTTPGAVWGLGGNYGFGLLRSTDGGSTWQQILDLSTFPTLRSLDYVRVVKIHPQDHNTVYVLAGQTVFVTSNATSATPTWTAVYTVNSAAYCTYGIFAFTDIEIIPGATGVSNSTVAVSTNRMDFDGSSSSSCGSAKMYISNSGGASGTFTDVSATVLGTFITDRISMALQPGNTSEIYVTYATCGGNTTGPSYINFGKINVSTLAVTNIALNQSNNFAAPGAGFWDLEFEFSKNNPNYFYIGGQILYKYCLSGTTLTSAVAYSQYTPSSATTTHADIRGMQVLPSGTTNDLIVLSDDGGVQEVTVPCTSMTTPTNWTNLNGSTAGSSLNITQYFGLACSEANYDELVAGAQDNGIHNYHSGSWTQWYGGDGWKGVINPITNMYYGLDNPGGLFAFTGNVTSGGLSSTTTPSPYGGGNSPVVTTQNNPNIIYSSGSNSTGGNDVFRSTNFGSSWSSISFPADGNDIRSIRVAPNAPDTIYVVKDNPTWGATGAATANRIWMGVMNPSTSVWTWTDIAASNTTCGALINGLSWACACDLAIDPNNAKRIWVTFNAYWNIGTTSAGQNRVVHSPDGGATWYDATNNLPPFPVNCITYQNGSNDVLYVGTDVGVFQFATAGTTPGVGTWNCFNQGLPIVAVTGIDINYCKAKIRISTYGRGIYVSDLPILTDFVVNSTTSWYGTHYVANDIYVTGNSTLNLYGTIYMSAGKRIKVDRGSVLNMHPNSLISNGCGDMWQGVEVYGTSATAQNVSGSQGIIVMQSGATISNALEGVSNAQMSGGVPVTGYTGGILECTGANFINNRRDVAMYSYHWYVGAYEQPNISYFKDCQFETNNGLNLSTQALNTHMTLNDVFKPTVLGCNFANNTANTIYASNYRGAGITSVDATYAIDNYYRPGITPPILISSTTFTGLTSGIMASYTNPTGRQVTVKNTTFNHNLHGMQVSNGANPSVTLSTFTAIPQGLTTNWVDATYGVDMYGCTGLLVNCNTFSGIYSTTSNNYGTIIDNCGSSTGNIVSNNTFSNVYAGVQAQGNNGTGTSGVQFECNTFQSSISYQMAVCPQNTGSIASQGSACTQGLTRQNNFFVPSSPYKQILSTNAALTYYASVVDPTVLSGSITINWCPSVSGECQTGCSSGGSQSSSALTPDDSLALARAVTEFSALESPEREIALAGAYIVNKQGSDAQAIITGFRSKGMTEAADYFGMEMDLFSNGKSWYDMSPSQLSRITEIAAGTSEVTGYANAVLQLLNGTTYQHQIERISLPSDEMKNKGGASNMLSDNIPNPFQHISAIQCQVEDGAQKSYLQISTALGDVIRTYNLVPGENNIVVDGSDLRQGVYYYSMFVNGSRVATKKMLVLH